LWAGVVTWLAAMGLLVGCGSHYVSGDSIHTVGEQKTLRPCRGEPTITLEQLSEMRAVTCDLSAAKIELAPGVLIDVPDDSHAVMETDAGTFGVVNLRGDLGVVVYNSRHQWGTREAVRLVRKAGWKP
jgi:hypothetical protein